MACKSPAEDVGLGTVRMSQKPVEMLYIQSSIDVELGTVLVSQQSVEMRDIQDYIDVELGTALVSQQLCELPHAPPVQAFTIRLVEMIRCV
ncbi:hypothetical protein TNCV_139841 [Trichonephila clavipes]|uniref:Uncharacterized protein n=1 Tax=Trichonephila clavipes TaxID=2585209 RepID=A0A8X6RFC0_TRICX|nr:hypothetical protein TNCV_139841 [Trichonephila clavipes]